VAFLVWVACDYLTGRKPSLLGGVQRHDHRPGGDHSGGGLCEWLGGHSDRVLASIIVYVALNYVSRLRPFRNVDDTLGVVYTHGFAGLAGAC